MVDVPCFHNVVVKNPLPFFMDKKSSKINVAPIKSIHCQNVTIRKRNTTKEKAFKEDLNSSVGGSFKVSSFLYLFILMKFII